MRKNVFGRQLKRDTNERKALFKGLMTALVMHERIETTEQKAKAIKASIEKLVTKARNKGILSKAELLPYLGKDAVARMIDEIAPRFKSRPGGYTRIIKLGKRFGDDASVVMMEWVEKKAEIEKTQSKPTNTNEKLESALKADSDKKASKKVTKKLNTKDTKNKKEKNAPAKKGSKK